MNKIFDGKSGLITVELVRFVIYADFIVELYAHRALLYIYVGLEISGGNAVVRGI